MKKKLIVVITTLALLFAPVAVVQAQRTGSLVDKQEIKSLMDKMAIGQLDADSQMVLSEMLGSKLKDGSRFGKFGKVDKSSPYFAVVIIVHVAFTLLILSLLFLLNVVLYKKLELMNKKKK